MNHKISVISPHRDISSEYRSSKCLEAVQPCIETLNKALINVQQIHSIYNPMY